MISEGAGRQDAVFIGCMLWVALFVGAFIAIAVGYWFGIVSLDIKYQPTPAAPKVEANPWLPPTPEESNLGDPQPIPKRQ